MNKAREKWTFEDEEELRILFDQFKDSEGMHIVLVVDVSYLNPVFDIVYDDGWWLEVSKLLEHLS